MINRYILIIIFALLTIANVYIYINRYDGFEYVQQSSYKDLYPNTTKGIQRITIEKDNIAVVDLKGYSSLLKWDVLCNDSFSNKINRYFNRQRRLEVYSENKTYVNSRFYLKTYLFLAG